MPLTLGLFFGNLQNCRYAVGPRIISSAQETFKGRQTQMAKHEESELRIVDVKGTFPLRQIRKPTPPVSRHSRLTPEEALKGLRSMKGATGVIELVPTI